MHSYFWNLHSQREWRQFIVFSVKLTIELGFIYTTDFWDASSLLTWDSSLQNMNEYVAALIALKQKIIDGE